MFPTLLPPDVGAVDKEKTGQILPEPDATQTQEKTGHILPELTARDEMQARQTHIRDRNERASSNYACVSFGKEIDVVLTFCAAFREEMRDPLEWDESGIFDQGREDWEMVVDSLRQFVPVPLPDADADAGPVITAEAKDRLKLYIFAEELEMKCDFVAECHFKCDGAIRLCRHVELAHGDEFAEVDVDNMMVARRWTREATAAHDRKLKLAYVPELRMS